MKDDISNEIRNVRVFNNVVRINKRIRNVSTIYKLRSTKETRLRNNDIYK